MNSLAVKVTDSAKEHLEGLILSQEKPVVRLSVKGGGCAGFQYEWTMADAQEADDELIPLENGHLAIDSLSLMYVIGTEIDFIKEVFGSYLVVKNPNSTSSCGCGESFSV